LADADGGLTNPVPLPEATGLPADSDGGLADAYIRLANADVGLADANCGLANAVALANAQVWLTETGGPLTDDSVRLSG